MALDIMDLMRQREESQRMRAAASGTTQPAVPATGHITRRTTATRTVVDEPDPDPDPEPISRSRQKPAPQKVTINDRLKLRRAVRQARDDQLDDYAPVQKSRGSKLSAVRTFFVGCALVLFPALGAILSLYFAFEKNKGEAGYLQSVQMLHVSQAIICVQLIVMLLYFVYWKQKMTKQLT